MKANLPKVILLACLISTQLFTSSTSFAKASGGGSIAGGGGDASEERVNEIRSDILKWINQGGGRDLRFNDDINYNEYVTRMKEVLKAKEVIVNFTDKPVKVNGVEKTCRNFFDEQEKGRMVCNIERFKGTSEAAQYRLIHHEYAGLVGIEKNDGSASDYSISGQISDYLTVQTVLRLAVKKSSESKEVKAPNFKITKQKLINEESGSEIFQTNLVLENSEDVVQISYMSEGKRFYVSNFDKDIIFKANTIELSDIIVQYQDGSIGKINNFENKISLHWLANPSKMKSLDFIKQNLVSEKDHYLEENVGNFKVEGLRLYKVFTYEIGFDFSKIDLTKYIGVVFYSNAGPFDQYFAGGDLHLFNDSDKLTDFLNNKVLEKEIIYRQGLKYTGICPNAVRFFTGKCVYNNYVLEDVNHLYRRGDSSVTTVIVGLVTKDDIVKIDMFKAKLIDKFEAK